MGKPNFVISLDNCDEYQNKLLINSPRSLEACKKEGILPEDLIYKPLEAFADKAATKEIQKIRHKYNEEKRKEMVKAAKLQREKIIRMLESSPNIKPGTFVTPIEELNISLFKGNHYDSEIHGTAQSLRGSCNVSRQLESQGLLNPRQRELAMKSQERETKLIIRKLYDEMSQKEKVEHLEMQENMKEYERVMQMEARHEFEKKKAEQKLRFMRDKNDKSMKELKKEKEKAQMEYYESLFEKQGEKRNEELKYKEMTLNQLKNDYERKDKINNGKRMEEEIADKKQAELMLKEMKIKAKRNSSETHIQNRQINARIYREMKFQKHKYIKMKNELEAEEKKRAILKKIEEENDAGMRAKRLSMIHTSDGFHPTEAARSEKIKFVKMEGDRKLEEKKETLIRKLDHMNEVLEQRKMENEIKKMIKKEGQMLKEKNKERNVERMKMKTNYKKELFLQKMDANDNKYKNFIKNKELIIQERYYNQMVNRMEKHYLTESLFDMKVKKKYEPKKIVEIVEVFSPCASAPKLSAPKDDAFLKQRMKTALSFSSKYKGMRKTFSMRSLGGNQSPYQNDDQDEQELADQEQEQLDRDDNEGVKVQ